MLKTYQHQFEVASSITRVAEFHLDARTLGLLTPPPVIVKFHMVQPLKEGSVVDFTLWLGPIPVRWVGVHHDIDPLTGFTDSMMKGPFEAWVHQHQFVALDPNRTRVIDTIKALPSPHPFWGLVSSFMWYTLPLLFAYRSWRTKSACNKPS